jgi:hypothetical protein
MTHAGTFGQSQLVEICGQVLSDYYTPRARLPVWVDAVEKVPSKRSSFLSIDGKPRLNQHPVVAGPREKPGSRLKQQAIGI